MSKYTSFLGEHTIELTIVPLLRTILLQDYEYVIPVFPWMTREGGKISKFIHKDDKFKILGLYPRRPKFNLNEENRIMVKLSGQTILGSQSGFSKGVPIIGGLPLVTNLWELGTNPNCIWLKLNYEPDLNDYLEHEIFPNNKYFKEKVYKSEHEILELIDKEAKTFSFHEALQVFREIQSESLNRNAYSSFFYMGSYKPIYFLMK